MQWALCLVSQIAVMANQKRWRKKTWPIFELWFESFPPPLSWIFHYFHGREKVLCVCVCWWGGGGGGILIVVHAWVINQCRGYWKIVDGRFCSEGKSKRGKVWNVMFRPRCVFWFVPVGSQDFLKWCSFSIVIITTQWKGTKSAPSDTALQRVTLNMSMVKCADTGVCCIGWEKSTVQTDSLGCAAPLDRTDNKQMLSEVKWDTSGDSSCNTH